MADAGAKLTDEIAHGAVREAEAFGDLGHRLLVHRHGADGFVAALRHGWGITEELLPAWVVHDRTSEIVTLLLVRTSAKGYP